MFGFIHRLLIEHEDEESGTYGEPKNQLIYFKLCIPYKEIGVYKASKSYVIRADTEGYVFRALDELRRRENIMPDPARHKPFILSGIQTGLVKTHKKWLVIALASYISSIGGNISAYHYMTEVDKQLEYLDNVLKELRKDYHSLISVEKLFGFGKWKLF
jgi:hypothetical protein